MSSTGVRARPDRDKMTSENMLLSDQQFVQRMKVFNAESPATGFVGTGTAGGTAPNGGSFLQDATAAVTGAFGLAQQSIDLVSETIAVSIQDFDEHWTSFANIANATADDILDLIDGGDYSGQILKLRIPDGVTNFVVNNANKVGNDTGNILIGGVDNLIVQGGEILEFIYDIFTTPQVGAQSNLKAGTLSGVWRLSSGSAAPTTPPTSALLGLSGNQVTSAGTGIQQILFDENFILGDTTKIQTTGTLGVFQLNDGIFTGDSHVSIDAVETGSGTEAVLVWQEADAEVGPWTTIPTPNQRGGTLVLGKPDVTTQPSAAFVRDYSGITKYVRLVINVIDGTVNLILGAATRANLSIGGAGSSGGGGGTGLTNPLEENLNLNGYNLLMDIDGDTFWKNERDGLADDWTQLFVGGSIGLNVSNRAGQVYVRSGFNLEPNSTSVTLGSDNTPWSEAYIDDFIDFDGISSPPLPSSTQGRIFWDNSTKSFHQLDDAGVNTDLVGSASDVSQWATFPAVADVVPNIAGRLLGTTTADEQWGGLFMDPSTFIRWETTLGVFTETTLRGTTGGFELNVPSAGSYSLDVAAVEKFKVDTDSVSINTPTLDFNNAAATIEGLVGLNYAFGGQINNFSSVPGIGGPHLVYDITGTNPGHLILVEGQEYIRIANDGDRTLDLRPDDANADPPTGIKNAREIIFLETGVPAITPGLAMITTDTSGAMIANVASGQQYQLEFGGDAHVTITNSVFSIIDNTTGTFRIANTVGNDLTISKGSNTPANFTCGDDITLRNDVQGLITDLQGFFDGANTVPSQIFLSGRNSVAATVPYAKIKSRIDTNTSGAHTGDLEFYAYRNGVEEEQITLKGKDTQRSGAVIYMRSNVEFLSQAANADQLILNEALLQMKERGDPGTVFGNDVTVWCDETAGVFSIKARFANGTVKTIADDT